MLLFWGVGKQMGVILGLWLTLPFINDDNHQFIECEYSFQAMAWQTHQSFAQTLDAC